MGVPSVWDITKRGFDERLPFSILVTNFHKEHGRPIRIAIDAYQWIFEAGSIGQASGLPFTLHTGKLIQSFHSRIKEMISLNVSFVFVFDGPLKPKFKRNIDLQKEQYLELENKDFDLEFLQSKELKDFLDQFGDFKEVLELKKELDRWNIAYVNAPSEGEAEASRLQKVGVVDYVLSNDSDTIIFGATKTLRNFSKFVEDKPAGATGCKGQDEFWCTPVDIENVELKTGFDRWRLLLFSILKGADYNTGVKNIGTEKASQIALSSTQFITKYIATCPYEELPDFSLLLKEIFQDPPSTYHYKRESELRRDKYDLFKLQLFHRVKSNLLEYFGRNEKALVKDGAFENFPPDYVVRLYFHPLLRNDIFQFKEGMTNFAESKDPRKWIDLPDFQASLDYFKLHPPPNVTDVEIWYTRTMSEAYLLRSVIHDLDIPATIERMKTKYVESFDIDLLSVRFKHCFPFGDIEDSEDEEQKKTKKGPLKWVPKDLVPVSSKQYLDFLERQKQALKEEEEKTKQSKKRSPRKKKPTQATTLMSMGFIDAPLKEAPLQRIQRRKTSDAAKQSTNVLDLLRAKTIPAPKKTVDIPSPVKKSSLFVTDSDLESDDDSSLEEIPSPEKAVKSSPTKLQTEIKSTVQESPIKVKSRKQDHNTSPSKGDRTYKLKDLENDEIPFASAKKKLDFTDISSSTPVKKTPVNNLKDTTTEDVTMITISDTSMINDSSVMEISRIQETPKSKTKNFSALDDILKPMEFSSDESE